jgi:hypothetical protein
MSGRRTIIPQRTPIFLGCEGDSEQAYGQVLNDLLRDAKKPIHLEVVNLNPGAGDPIARLKRAAQEIARRSPRRSEFHIKRILMDSDQIIGDAQRRREAEQLAAERGITIIWQEPCHEAMLLRHLEGFAQHKPPTSALAMTALKAAWPSYQKPMTKLHLSKRIDFEAIQRAAAVEPSLGTFLCEIALMPR